MTGALLDKEGNVAYYDQEDIPRKITASVMYMNKIWENCMKKSTQEGEECFDIKQSNHFFK